MAQVSVIIPTYNGASYVASAIQSALNQTFEDLEILIVDDASTDRTLNEIEPFLTDKRVKLLCNTSNLGIPATKNKAVKMARGQFIAFLDQDDVWLPNKLEVQINHLKQDDNIGVIASAIYFIDESGNLIGKKILNIENAQPLTQVKRLLLGNFITNSSAVVRRSCFDKVGYFNENLRGSDDYDLWVRIAKYFKIHYLNQILIKKRLHKLNFSELNIQTMMEGKLQVINSAIQNNPSLADKLNIYIANVHRSAAIKYALNGQISQAKNHFAQALKSGNRSFITFAGYFLSLVSPLVLAKITYLGQSLKRRHGVTS
jgi:glycosyltransferase involved in cell wall biosynthesis